MGDQSLWGFEESFFSLASGDKPETDALRYPLRYDNHSCTLTATYGVGKSRNH